MATSKSSTIKARNAKSAKKTPQKTARKAVRKGSTNSQPTIAYDRANRRLSALVAGGIDGASGELMALIRAHHDAHEAVRKAPENMGDRAFTALNRAEDAAMKAMLLHPATGLGDFQARGRYLQACLVARPDWLEESNNVEWLLGGLVNVDTNIDPDAKLFAAYDEWARCYDAFASRPIQSDADDAPSWVDLQAAEAALMKFEPVTARGFAAQLMAFTSFGEFGIEASRDFDFEQHAERIANVQRPASLVKKQPVPEDRVIGSYTLQIKNDEIVFPDAGTDRAEKRITSLTAVLARWEGKGVDPFLFGRVSEWATAHAKLSRCASAGWDETEATPKQKADYLIVDAAEIEAMMEALRCPALSGIDQRFKADYLRTYEVGSDIMAHRGAFEALLDGMTSANDTTALPDIANELNEIDAEVRAITYVNRFLMTHLEFAFKPSRGQAIDPAGTVSFRFQQDSIDATLWLAGDAWSRNKGVLERTSALVSRVITATEGK